MLRRLRWSIGLLPALVLVIAAGNGREAQGQSIGLNFQNLDSNFKPVADANSNYATVTGSVAYDLVHNITTVDFVVTAYRSVDAIVRFGFNTDSSVPTIAGTSFHVYKGTTVDSHNLISNVKLVGSNESDAGTFSYVLGGSLNSNKTQSILVEFTVSGNDPLSDFVMPNSAGNDFVAHLKTPSNGTGFVYGSHLPPDNPNSTPGTVPEPPSIIGASIVGLVGLGYRWRQRRRLARAV